MFRANYQLPVTFGDEPYSISMQAPTSVRMYVDPIDVGDNTAAMRAAEALVEFHAGHIAQWMQATRQVAYAGGNQVYGRELALDRCRCDFQINNRQETLTLYVRPQTGVPTIPQDLFIDIRTNFRVFPIPGLQKIGNNLKWKFHGDQAQGNQEGTFYTFYDPAFSPGDRKVTTPPVMAAGASGQPSHIYTEYQWEPDSDAHDPTTSLGYIADEWLTDIGGTGYYEVLLKDKQYWEVEIKQLPTRVPDVIQFTLSGTDDGSSYDDPTLHKTPTLYRRLFPAGLNTFLNPVVGVIPKHFEEKFVPPDKSKDYTQDQLDGEPQVPPRDNIRFTHKIIGLDPTTDKPRSIGAVRNAVIKGDETTVSVTQLPAGYKVTFSPPYGPYLYSTTTLANIYDSLGRLYGQQSIPSGWEEDPRFFGPGSDTALEWSLCGANPYYDQTPTPATNPSRSWFLHEYSVANGQVYVIVDITVFGMVRENEGTYPSFVTSWFLPGSGPPPGFVAPGAPAKRWPLANNGPYWRCIGFVGGPFYGPAYRWVTAGPRYDDPGSSFPTTGPATEIRAGQQMPNTMLVAEGGGPATKKTDVFHDQLFGDWLKQDDGGAEEGSSGARTPRKLMVPLAKGPGRYMPVIKGRGDLITKYRDELTADSNYDPTGDNDGYDTGVELGDIKEGDRIMFASDTKTGELYIGINGVWKGPDGGPCDPKKGIGFAALMDREKDDVTGKLKDAEYYAAGSYKYGPTWMRLWLGRGLKYKAPDGFDLLGRTVKSIT